MHFSQNILRFWLDQPAVYGVRIGGFNVLFEDWANPAFVSSDLGKTMEFLEELRNITREYTEKDGLDR